MAQPHVDARDAQASEAVTTTLMIWFALTIGLVTALGDSARWDSLIYDTARVVPGAPGTWGWTLTAFSIMAGVGFWFNTGRSRRWLLCGGLFMCSVWGLFLGLSFLNEFAASGQVSALGVILMGMLTVLYMMRAVLYWGATRPASDMDRTLGERHGDDI